MGETMRVGPRLGTLHRRRFFAAIPAVALLVSIASGAEHRATHDRVITYLSETSRDGALVVEWRIFDPVVRTDTLFRSFSGHEPVGIYWDTTGADVQYLDSGTLFRNRWELASQPWPVLQLPENRDISDWWFNADSLCWQAVAVVAVSHGQTWSGTPLHRCRMELWQSDRDGAAWHAALAETIDCEDCSLCRSWKVPDPRGVRRQAAIGFSQLQEAMTIDDWGGTPEAISPPAGESATSSGWRFIPSRSAPERGLALRIGQRSPNLKTLMGPFYLADRRRGTQRLLETPALRRDEETWRMGMVEHDGFLLVTGIRTYVYDLNTGDQIFHPSGYVRRAAVWVKRPPPASVDSLGLRRLRARFR